MTIVKTATSLQDLLMQVKILSSDNHTQKILIITPSSALKGIIQLFLDKFLSENPALATGKILKIKTCKELVFELAFPHLIEDNKQKLTFKDIFLSLCVVNDFPPETFSEKLSAELYHLVSMLFDQWELNNLFTKIQHSESETVSLISQLIDKVSQNLKNHFINQADLYSLAINTNSELINNSLLQNHDLLLVLINYPETYLDQQIINKLIGKKASEQAHLTQVKNTPLKVGKVTIIETLDEATEINLALQLAEALADKSNRSVGITWLSTKPYNDLFLNCRHSLINKVSGHLSINIKKSSIFRFLNNFFGIRNWTFSDLLKILSSTPVNLKSLLSIESLNEENLEHQVSVSNLFELLSNLNQAELVNFLQSLSFETSFHTSSLCLNPSLRFHELCPLEELKQIQCCKITNGIHYCLGDLALLCLKSLKTISSNNSEFLATIAKKAGQLLQIVDLNSLQDDPLEITIANSLTYLLKNFSEPQYDNQPINKFEFFELLEICLKNLTIQLKGPQNIKVETIENLLSQGISTIIIMGSSDQASMLQYSQSTELLNTQQKTHLLSGQINLSKTYLHTALTQIPTVIFTYPRNGLSRNSAAKELPWLKEFEATVKSSQQDLKFNFDRIKLDYWCSGNPFLTQLPTKNDGSSNDLQQIKNNDQPLNNLNLQRVKLETLKSFSANDLITYLICPKRFFFARQLGLDKLTSEQTKQNSSIGLAIHELLKLNLKEIRQIVKKLAQNKNVGQFLSSTEAIVRNTPTEQVTPLSNSPELLAYLCRGLANAALLDYAWNIKNQQLSDSILETKWVAKIELKDCSNKKDHLDQYSKKHIELSGIIDRVDIYKSIKTLSIIDYKTHISESSSRNRNLLERASNNFQQIIYHTIIASLEDYDGFNISAVLFEIDCNEIDLNLLSALSDDENNFDWLFNAKANRSNRLNALTFKQDKIALISEVVSLINDGFFPATPSLFKDYDDDNCTYCPYLEICPSSKVADWVHLQDPSAEKIVEIRKNLAENND